MRSAIPTPPAAAPTRAPRAPALFSVRSHLLLLIFATMVPVIAFAAAVMVMVAQQGRAQLQVFLDEAAIKVSAGVDAELRKTIAALEILALSTPIATGDLPAFHALARRVTDSQPSWANVQLIGPGGEHLVNARLPFGSPLPPLNHPELAARAAASRTPIVSDMARGVVAGRHLIVVYVPVVQSGEVKYVLTAAVESHNWQGVLRSLVSLGIDATLLDRNSAVIASTRGEAREAASGERVARRTSSFSGWTVVSSAPAHAFDVPVRTLVATLTAGFGLLLAAGLLLALLLSRRLTRSIAQLVASVRRVGRGEPPLPADTRIAEMHDASESLQAAAALLATRLEREHSARAELEAASRSKDQFLAMLAHELRNPLAPIRNAVRILEYSDFDRERVRWATNVINRQSAHLARLVDDLIDVSRIERGKVELRLERLDLRKVLENAVEDYRSFIHAAAVDVALDLPRDEVPVEGDAVRLAQVVGNLLHNACKFTPPGGKVALSLTAGEGRARIVVEDSGPGIDPAILQTMFEPFVQGSTAASAAKGGLGLGLALVKGLTEMHGGTVEAGNAAAGTGARFVLALPTLEAAGAGEGPRPETPYRQSVPT